jgi:hypothetical protein
VMAQYVKAAPASALKVSLDMLSKAFDDFMISKEDWDSIEQEVAMMAQSQQGGAPGQQAGPGQPMQAPPGAQPGMPPGGAAGAPPGGGVQVAAMVVQALQQLPPPVLQAIGGALAQGVPPKEIFQQMLQAQAGGGAAGGAAA